MRTYIITKEDCIARLKKYIETNERSRDFIEVNYEM